MAMRNAPSKGFTLIELIMVIVIVGVMATVIAPILSGPFTAYTDSNRRASLVQQAHGIVQRIQLDLSYAVPGSIEVSSAGSTQTLDWTPLLRDPNTDHQPALRYVSTFDVEDENATSIEVLGCAADPVPDDHAGQSVILGTLSGASGVVDITNPTGCASGSPESTIDVEDPNRFEYGSPFYRLYLAGPGVRITCDESTGQITRQVEGEDSRLIGNNIAGCDLTWNAGSLQNQPSLVVDITLTDPEAESEAVRLVKVLSLENEL